MKSDPAAEAVTSAQFKAYLSALKTRYGSWQVVLDASEDDAPAVLKMVGMVGKPVSAALVLVKEDL